MLRNCMKEYHIEESFSQHCKALLSICRNSLLHCKTLLSICKSSLQYYKTLLQICKSFLQRCEMLYTNVWVQKYAYFWTHTI